MAEPAAVAVIVGSAFGAKGPDGLDLEPVDFDTPFGPTTLHRVGDRSRWLVFRHGLPHTYLPNQVNYRANAWALREAGVTSLLVTSSVGVMTPGLPLFVPLPLSDLLMLDNRLPDGSACTMFVEPAPEQGHLVLNDGLFSSELDAAVAELAQQADVPLGPSAVFAYVQGPRTKTAAENRMLASLGAEVNSMTTGPEVVLANELEIAVSALVVGHKYSVPERDNPDEGGIERSLAESRLALERVVAEFLRARPTVPFGNHIYRFAKG